MKLFLSWAMALIILEGSPSRVVSVEKNMDWLSAFVKKDATKTIERTLIIEMRASMTRLKLQGMASDPVKKSTCKWNTFPYFPGRGQRKHAIPSYFSHFKSANRQILQKRVPKIFKKNRFYVTCLYEFYLFLYDFLRPLQSFESKLRNIDH